MKDEKREPERNKWYLYVVVIYWLLYTAKTFFIEERWFDFVFYGLTIIAIAVFAIIEFKKRKLVVSLVACVLFFAYLFEIVPVPIP
ncbi:hypothetical protein [Halobacillus aidingensis]|uniref:Uncharacterized protein n=1 Tax=Halobacillus aidingensis TaxID=240303 RepID=A0A1H0FM14_HALAD|nr:hypothetical protein [Halobacillus aidingensis]SDN95706.1 hypothetical protein SAMN05421677_10250 [Halobacillus aidingensis]